MVDVSRLCSLLLVLAKRPTFYLSKLYWLQVAMMNRIAVFAVCVLFLVPAAVQANDEAESADLLDWSSLPDFPADRGVAGPFVGVHNDAVIVAGGANFPDGVPWGKTKSSLKHYYADAFVLTCPAEFDLAEATWHSAKTKLSEVVGYGASISHPDGIICIGGEWKTHTRQADGSVQSQSGKSTNVFVLRWNANEKDVEITSKLPLQGRSLNDLQTLPALPVGTSDMAAVMIGDVIYVAGGNTSNGATANFWCLDLSKRGDAAGSGGNAKAFNWEKLPSWPGSPRRHAIGVVQNDGSGNCLYLFSGRNKQTAAPFKLLTDAYRFSPKEYSRQQRKIKSSEQFQVWKQLKEIKVHGEKSPRCLMAGTGTKLGNQHIAVFGGDSGELFHQIENEFPVQIKAAAGTGDTPLADQLGAQRNKLRDTHPGFTRDILLYHTITDTWVKKGETPETSQVTTSAVQWRDSIVIPTGEIRPGVRTRKIWIAKPVENAQGFGIANWTVVVLYTCALLGLGVYFSGGEKSTDDFFLARGRIPWWAAGLSIFATMLSAITYLAIPAKAFEGDWTLFLYNMGIPLVAPFVILFYLPFFRKLNVTTAYEYLEARFDVGIRIVGSSSFILFQLGRMGIVVLLPALALSAVTGLTVVTCIIIMGVLSTVYTVLGGIEAVIWTDVLQTIVLVGGALAAVFIMATGIDGGLGEMIDTGLKEGKFNLAQMHWDWTSDALAIIIIGSILNNVLQYTSDQAIVQRYMTGQTDHEARRAIWLNALLVIPASILFFGVGTALYVFYLHHPDRLAPIGDSQQIFPWFIVTEMPAGLAGLVIAGVFAAAMSTLDSSMHSIATALTTDFYRRFQPDRSEEYFLKVARILTILLGVLGTVSAIVIWGFNFRNLWDYYIGFVGLLLGTLGGLFTLGIFTRRTSSIHAWIGVLAAAAAMGFAKYGTDLSSKVHGAIAMAACVGVGAIAGFLIRRRPQNVEGLTIGSPQPAD